jgi:hypothetical protein
LSDSEGKVPAVFGFVRSLSRRGLEDEEVRERIKSLSYMEIATLREHPDFQKLLSGIVLKRFLLGEKIPTDARWALRYLASKHTASEDFDENGNSVGGGTVQVLDVTPREDGAA